MAKTTPPAATAAVMPSQLLCSIALCSHSSAIETVDITPTAEPSRNANVASSGDRLMAMMAPMDVDRPGSDINASLSVTATRGSCLAAKECPGQPLQQSPPSYPGLIRHAAHLLMWKGAKATIRCQWAQQPCNQIDERGRRMWQLDYVQLPGPVPMKCSACTADIYCRFQ